MTGLARWLALISIGTLVVGLLRQSYLISLLGLSVLLWMLTEWILFTARTRRELARLRFERRVNNNTESGGVLWTNRVVDVELKLVGSTFPFAPLSGVRDIVPEILELVSSKQGVGTVLPRRVRLKFWDRWWKSLVDSVTKTIASLDADIRWHETRHQDKSLFEVGSNQWSHEDAPSLTKIHYQVRPRCAGEVSFPGLRLHFQDKLGLFRHDVVLRKKNRFRILPPYVESGETNPMTKRMNAIPQHGIHRQPRPGLGFELLELREYVDGDPPKSIAWKATARRDILMTRQYESEIPIRIQLIIDGTSTSRIGGFGLRLIDQYALVAASVAKMAASAGDLVGAYIVDDDGMHRTAAKPGTPGFYEVLQSIAQHAINRKPPRARLLPSMIDWSYAICSERYPELLEPRFNPSTLGNISLLTNRWLRQRNQLAAILAELYDLGAGQHAAMLFDDAVMADHLQRFMCDEGMPWMAPVVSAYDIESIQVESELGRLTQALNAAVLRARDNEVFVLFADLIRNNTGLEDLCSAIKVARARHHRVAVVCASPTFVRPSHTSWVQAKEAAEMRRIADMARIFERAQVIKRKMLELGAPFSMSGELNAVPLVLSEITLARSGRHVSSEGRR